LPKREGEKRERERKSERRERERERPRELCAQKIDIDRERECSRIREKRLLELQYPTPGEEFPANKFEYLNGI
jgi:hypothetical protein